MIGDIEKGYDLTSVAQAEGTIESLRQNPFEQQLLEKFSAELTAGEDLLCDLGCGPGQIAGYFHDRGFDIVGVDFSAGMLKEARKFNPGVRFVKANMKKLPFKNGELAGIVGFFSLCHIPRWEVPLVLTELKRALRPSGQLLLSFHLGKGTFFRTESWGKPVSFQTTMFQSLELQDHLTTAGFKVMGSIERPADQVNGARGYLWVMRPSDESHAALSLRDAVLTGSAKEVEALLSTGLSPDTIFDGCTALHVAAGDGRLQILKVLLRAGAKVDVHCWGGGGTALYVAIQMGQLAAARQLVEAGADPGSMDGQGNTLLHMACYNGRTDIAKWLLQLRVDPRPKNKQGETPADWAARAGFGALAETLR